MLTTLKRNAKKSKTLLIAFNVYKNWRTRRRFANGQIESLHGSTHSRKSLQESLAYIDAQFTDYLNYASLSKATLKDKRILELGFGDNLGVALKFTAAGARQVVGIDKFYSTRNASYERDIYRALRSSLVNGEVELFDQAVSLEDGIRLSKDRLLCINGVALEEGINELSALKEPFDLVISRAVIEEIYQPDKLFTAVDQVLAPGGFMIHKIDLSDYGMFCESGMHPLTFLTISDAIYKLMATDSGIPNRKRIGYYRDEMDRLGYTSAFFITSILGVGPVEPHKEVIKRNEDYGDATLELINQIRPSLAEPFNKLSDDELMVDGIFLVAQKPLDTVVKNQEPATQD